MAELSGVKLQQRTMWTLGDYPTFAECLQPAADALVRRTGVAAGAAVLDVATGSGNAAITAAEAGAARVVGLDLTPELFDVARRRAAAGGWEIEWVDGDAEDLPFADQSFDRVLSVFGAMFAPDHRRTAAELVRVCRADGAIGSCAWTPDGVFGLMIRLLISRAPAPPPPDFKPPGLWGHEDYVRSLFDGLGVRLEFEPHDVVLEHDSAEAWVAYLEQVFGPTIMAKAALGPSGEWEALRADLVDLWESHNVAGADGGLRVPMAYLMTIAHPSAD